MKMPSLAPSYHSGRGCRSSEASVASYFTLSEFDAKGSIPPINQVTAGQTPTTNAIATAAQALRDFILLPLAPWCSYHDMIFSLVSTHDLPFFLHDCDWFVPAIRSEDNHLPKAQTRSRWP